MEESAINHYCYNELAVGMQQEFQVTITQEMLSRFCTMTGDVNPLHCNAEYAKSSGYSGTVAYGMLTASFLSTLAGVYLPGERSLIHSVETKFLLPVFVGDTLTVHGEIAEMHDTFSMLILKVQISNQNGKKVCRGKMQIGVRS